MVFSKSFLFINCPSLSKLGGLGLWILGWLSGLFLVLGLPQKAEATPISPLKLAKPQIPDPQWIQSGISLYFTDRGLKKFENDLLGFIENLGVSPGEAYFPLLKLQADQPIGLDRLLTTQEQKDRVSKIHQQLSQWLIGIPLMQFRPELRVSDIHFQASFKRFALVPDEQMLHSIGKSEGAVLVLELETQKLMLSASQIRALDLDQQDLGEMGFDGAQATVGPFYLNLPLWVNIEPTTQKFEFKALPPTSSFAHTPIELKYKKIVRPTVMIQIGNRKIYLNDQEVERQIQSQMPKIVDSLRSFFHQAATQMLPDFLNSQVRDNIDQGFEELNTLNPPGSPGLVAAPFYWGMKPRVIKQQAGLWLILNTFVEDPTLGPVKPMEKTSARKAPLGRDIKVSEYDFMLSLDRAFINRIMQLSYLRGYMKEVEAGVNEQDQPKIMSLTQPLSVDGVVSGSTKNGALMKVAVHARAPKGSVTGSNKLALDDEFRMSFEIITELKSTVGNGVVVVLKSIDLDSVYVEPSDMTWVGRMMKGKVLAGVKKELKAASEPWSKAEEVLPGSLPLPPEVLGLQTSIVGMNFEETGQLVMYLEYK